MMRIATVMLVASLAYAADDPELHLQRAQAQLQGHHPNYAEAEKEAQRAVVLWRDGGGVPTAHFAEALTILGMLKQHGGKVPASDVLPLYQYATSIREGLGEHDTLELALLYELCSYELKEVGEPEKAKVYFDKAAVVRRADIDRMSGERAPLNAEVKIAEQPAEIKTGVKAPRVTYRVEPNYSQSAQMVRFQGALMLALIVDEQGRVRRISLKRGLGLGLDEEAFKAVSQWKFLPAEKDGHPVAVSAYVEVNFRLLY